MEKNLNYRRHVSTARLGLTVYLSGESLLKALSDSRGKLVPYRCTSLSKCLLQYFPEYFAGINIPFLLSYSYIADLVFRIRVGCNISAIEFYSNGDIKLHFFPIKYDSSNPLK